MAEPLRLRQRTALAQAITRLSVLPKGKREGALLEILCSDEWRRFASSRAVARDLVEAAVGAIEAGPETRAIQLAEAHARATLAERSLIRARERLRAAHQGGLRLSEELAYAMALLAILEMRHVLESR